MPEPMASSHQGGTLPSVPDDAALRSKSLNELRTLAKHAGITGYSSLNKDSLIERLAAAAAGRSNDSPNPKPPPKRSSGAGKPYAPALWEKISAISAAVFIVGLASFLIVRNERFNDPNLVVLIRILLSTCVGILGATIPGFLQIDLSGRGALIRAGGALALFLLTFLFSPNVIQPTENPSQTNASPSSPIVPVKGEPNEGLGSLAMTLPSEDAKFRSGIRRKDVIEGIKTKYTEREYARLCQDFGFSDVNFTSEQNIGAFLDHCIASGQLLRLLIVLLDKYDVKGTSGDWQADTPDKSHGPFPRLTDGTFDLTGGPSEKITLQVVFKTTGERFSVQLPEDLDCDTAAQRIIANIFFRDIPIERRAAYLAPGAHYHLLLSDKTENLKGTLREAGLKSGAEVKVSTVAPRGGYPWIHDKNTADMMLDRHFSSWIDRPEYRLLNYASVYMDKRLHQAAGKSFAGLLFHDPVHLGKPWNVSLFLGIVHSKAAVPTSLLDYLSDVLKAPSDDAEGDRASAALAVARLGPRALRLLPDLIKGTQSDSTKFARSCVVALGQMLPASNEAVSELERISTQASDGIERLYAALMMLRFREDSNGRTIVARVLGSGDPEMRLKAVKSLGWDFAPYVSPETCTPIEDLMTNRFALGRFLGNDEEAPPKTKNVQAKSAPEKRNRAALVITEHLTKTLSDQQPRVRMEAAYTLPHYGVYAKLAVPRLIDMLMDKEAVIVKGELGDNDERRTEVRESAENALGRLGPVAKEAVPALVSLVVNRDEIYWMRNRVASSLKSIGTLGEPDIRRLEDYLRTEDDAVGVKESVRELLKEIRDKKNLTKEGH
jgi:HEAT repeat protein